MDKEDVVHIYRGILFSHLKKERNLAICEMRWIDLETVIQSEVSQKEKNKYCMLTRIYGVKKINGHEEPRGRMGIKTQAYLRMDWST